jgi:phage replication-related protein YjqB (UPF0714/DUF867 family)
VFAELLAHPGVTEELVLGSTVGFLAFHGGSLERMTDVIARDAAARSGASYYGVLQPPDFRWHIPSRQVDPAASASLRAFLERVDVAIAVHGYGRADRWTTLLLGGSNRALAAHLATHLAPALPHYDVIDDLDEIPTELRGMHPDNPVNRPPHGGVQLELPPRVRGMGPYWQDHAGDGLRPHTEALVEALAGAARAWTTSAPTLA